MIELQNITKIYPLRGIEKVVALEGVNLQIKKGETLGLVGGSGSGKSTLGKILLGLTSPTSGKVLVENKEKKGLLPLKMQMIFQDPISSLNPRMKVGSILEEPTKIHKLPSRVNELLDLVGLFKDAKNRYPHEFSGGQRQRIGIARALALNPEILICDEPISALDVSIQAQVINLLVRLQKELNLTMLFIGHDLAMVRHISEKIAVMDRGKIVEENQVDALFKNPLHPTTKLLLSSAFLSSHDLQNKTRQGALTRSLSISKA